MIGLGRKRKDVVEPVPVERTCLCGERLYGMRGRRGGSLSCDRCGRTWFLLPVDPYPTWPRSRRRKRKQRVAVLKQVRARAVDGGRRAVATTRRRSAAAAGKGRAWATARWRSNRFRLVAVVTAVVVLIGSTAWWSASRASLRAAGERLASATVEARAAAAAGDFARVRGLLESLVDLRPRGEQASLAAAARQRFREAVVAEGLATRTLHQIASEAAATYDAKFPGTWRDRFAALYEDRWVIVDTFARREPVPGDDAETVRTELDVAFLDPSARFVVEAGDHDFGLPGVWPSPRRVLFAARVAACDPVDDDGEAWVIRLSGDDLLLWADAVSLAAIGFGGDVASAEADAGQTLAEQRARAGLADEHFSADFAVDETASRTPTSSPRLAGVVGSPGAVR